MAEVADAASADGRSAEVGGLGSYGPGARIVATIPLGRFLQPWKAWEPFEDVWEVEVMYNGLLGQWVVETYEWRIRARIKDDRSVGWWQLRRLQVQTTVPGAASVDQRFDVA